MDEFDGVRAGADRLGLRVVFRVLVEHESGTAGQHPQQVRVRRAELEFDGVRVARFDGDEVDQRIGVMVLLRDELVDGPCHVVGVELVSVRERHAVIEMKRVCGAVVADIPCLRDGWYDLIVLVARHESLVDVADEYLVDGRSGGVADVEVGGREFQPDGDRIVRLGARRVVFASGERRDASRDDGDDRDHGDDGDDPPCSPPVPGGVLGAALQLRVHAGRGALVRRSGFLCVQIFVVGCAGVAVRTMVFSHDSSSFVL